MERIRRCQSREVLFVTDQYFEMSIKGGERDKRASTGQIGITASRQDQAPSKQFKKYLQAGTNKTKLLQFLIMTGKINVMSSSLEKKGYLLRFRRKARLFKLLKEKL